MIQKWLKNDKIALGLILGIVIPIASSLFFVLILRLIQDNFQSLVRIREADMILLGLAVNLIVMRYYLVKLKFENEVLHYCRRSIR